MPTPPLQSLLNTAADHLNARRFTQAETTCRQILSTNPNHPEALNFLAVVMRQTGQLDAAIAVMIRAVAAHPQIAEFHSNLGEFLRQAGKLDESIASFTRAIQLKPNEPTFHNSLGIALGQAHQYDAAIARLSQAIKLKPDYADAYNSIGTVHRSARRFDEALASFQTAIRLQPNMPQAHHNLGLALSDMRKFPEAIAAYSKAIAIKPDYAMAHWNLGMLHLLLGDFQRGWPEYEWRLSGPRTLASGGFSQPRWDSGDLHGKTIFLPTEQGFGDLIQFIRYVPMIAEKGGRILVGCHPELSRLLATVPHVEKVIPLGQTPPPFDVYCPVMSLPLAFNTTQATIPANIPYLKPNPDLRQTWAQKLASPKASFRIGIAWAGRPEHEDDLKRSIRLDQFAPLAAIEGVEFFSLQKGPSAQQAANPPTGMTLIDRTSELADFADTAAMIDNLNLLICVDTAVAHLAGALAKPVWVLLQAIPDWRWMLDRPDTPWYPTMRLFRQKTPGDWDEVLQRIVQALQIEIELMNLK